MPFLARDHQDGVGGGPATASRTGLGGSCRGLFAGLQRSGGGARSGGRALVGPESGPKRILDQMARLSYGVRFTDTRSRPERQGPGVIEVAGREIEVGEQQLGLRQRRPASGVRGCARSSSAWRGRPPGTPKRHGRRGLSAGSRCRFRVMARSAHSPARWGVVSGASDRWRPRGAPREESWRRARFRGASPRSPRPARHPRRWGGRGGPRQHHRCEEVAHAEGRRQPVRESAKTATLLTEWRLELGDSIRRSVREVACPPPAPRASASAFDCSYGVVCPAPLPPLPRGCAPAARPRDWCSHRVDAAEPPLPGEFRAKARHCGVPPRVEPPGRPPGA